MKKNIKNQVLIFLLLLAMVVLVFICTLLVVINMLCVFKIYVVIMTILSTFYIFTIIKKLNKKLVYEEKENNIQTEMFEVPERKLLCPRCHNFYDGKICFVCGLRRLR